MKIIEVDYKDILQDAAGLQYNRKYNIPVRHSGNIKRLIKMMGGHCQTLDNGHIRWVNSQHTILIENILLDPKLINVPDEDGVEEGEEEEEIKISIPTLVLPYEVEDIAGIDSENIAFKSGDVISLYGLQIVLPIIDTFGKPDKILMNEEYPAEIYYPNDMKVLIAPRINTSDEPPSDDDDFILYKFDFKPWFPRFYGLKRKKISAENVLDILELMNPDVPLREALDVLRSEVLETESRNETIDEFV